MLKVMVNEITNTITLVIELGEDPGEGLHPFEIFMEKVEDVMDSGSGTITVPGFDLEVVQIKDEAPLPPEIDWTQAGATS